MKKIKALSAPLATFPVDLLSSEVKLYNYLQHKVNLPLPTNATRKMFMPEPFELDVRNTLDSFFSRYS